jgi:hypothetical protein
MTPYSLTEHVPVKMADGTVMFSSRFHGDFASLESAVAAAGRGEPKRTGTHEWLLTGAPLENTMLVHWTAAAALPTGPRHD